MEGQRADRQKPDIREERKAEDEEKIRGPKKGIGKDFSESCRRGCAAASGARRTFFAQPSAKVRAKRAGNAQENILFRKTLPRMGAMNLKVVLFDETPPSPSGGELSAGISAGEKGRR